MGSRQSENKAAMSFNDAFMEQQDAAAFLTQHGVVNYQAQLPEGMISWQASDGQTVLHARVKAVLSWAAANRSVMWCAAAPQLIQAGVPVIQVPGQSYLEGIDELSAISLAEEAARGDGAFRIPRARARVIARPLGQPAGVGMQLPRLRSRVMAHKAAWT